MKINYLTFVTLSFRFFLPKYKHKRRKVLILPAEMLVEVGVVQLFYRTNCVFHSGGNRWFVSTRSSTTFLEISVIIALDETSGINLVASKAYPNPTYDFLTLKIDDFASLTYKAMTYQLFDMNGALLKQKK